MDVSSVLSSSLLCVLLILSNGLNDEGLALLSFKTSILEDPSGSLANWNSSDRDPCNWNGITCKQSAVVSLALPKNGLLGSLPSSLGSLASLRHVNLRSNRLSGILPPGILKPRSLQSLVLYGNSLSGFLPPEVGTLSSLQLLDLSHNSMNGSIPVSIVQCRRLRTLVLSHNSFTGSLPFGTGFSALEMFDVSYNRLSGPIPADIGSLRSLDGIADLSHNLFSGPVPASIGDLPERVYVDLSYNNLSGPIPQNGSLANRGPSVFVGNPGLCGPPLKSPCVSANVSSIRNGGSVRRRVVIVLIVSDVVAIALLALAFYCLYRRAILSKGVEEKWESNGRLRRNECLCFGKDELEKFDLIPLDKNVRFDLDELLQATAFVLSKSSTGIVYKIVMDDDGLTLAVRRFGEGGQRRFKEFQREVEAIGKLRHANLVALRAYYWSIDEKLLVYDYIPNGNLALALHGRAGGSFSPMSWRVRLQIIKGIANGLAFLHGFSPKGYVHGDLKPSNILLGLKMEPHISNFRLRRLAWLTEENTPERPQSQFSDSAVSPVSSRPYYQPPEVFRSVKPSQKWDVYSYGVILLEIISGRSPEVLLDTMEMDLVQWFQFCIEERKPTFDVFDRFLAQEPDMEDEIIAVLKVALACVQFDPERRPSMWQVNDTLERSIAIN